MEGDEVLKIEGNKPIFGKDLYYISILGKPSEKDPWMLQFGGHHLALNITIAGERGVLTPTLTGAQPALYTSNGKTVRPLGQEGDKTLALLNALDETSKETGISELQASRSCARARTGRQDDPARGFEGFTNEQWATLDAVDLISEWAGIIHESAAAARVAELKADLNETWFA